MRVAEQSVIQTYTLELLGPKWAHESPGRVLIARSHIEEAEENLTDLLPPGFSVRIKEWDE